MYAKLLQPRQGGSVSVRELLVRGGRAIVRGTFANRARNSVRQSAEMFAALSGSPSQGRPISSDVSGEVERVGLRTPVVQKHAEEGEVVLEAYHAILLKNRVALAVPLD
jgi:hypothetical protein